MWKALLVALVPALGRLTIYEVQLWRCRTCTLSISPPAITLTGDHTGRAWHVCAGG